MSHLHLSVASLLMEEHILLARVPLDILVPKLPNATARALI